MPASSKNERTSIAVYRRKRWTNQDYSSERFCYVFDKIDRNYSKIISREKSAVGSL